MALTATLQAVPGPSLSGPFFQSAPIGAVLIIYNSATVPVQITTISPWSAGTGPGNPPTYAQRELQATGAQPYNPLAPFMVPAAGSLTFAFDYLIPMQNIQGNAVDGIDSYFQLGATIYSNDATSPVLSPVPQSVATTSGVPISAGGQGGAPLAAPAPGQIRYDLSFSSPCLFLW